MSLFDREQSKAYITESLWEPVEWRDTPDPDLLAHFPPTDQSVIPEFAQCLLLCGRMRFRPPGLCPLPFLVILSPAEERRAREWPLETAELPEGHLEDWLEKRAKRLSSAPSSRYRPQDYPSFFLGAA